MEVSKHIRTDSFLHSSNHGYFSVKHNIKPEVPEWITPFLFLHRRKNLNDDRMTCFSPECRFNDLCIYYNIVTLLRSNSQWSEKRWMKITANIWKKYRKFHRSTFTSMYYDFIWKSKNLKIMRNDRCYCIIKFITNFWANGYKSSLLHERMFPLIRIAYRYHKALY